MEFIPKEEPKTISNFYQLVEQYIVDHGEPIDGGSTIGYQPLSGRFFYDERPFSLAVRAVPDDINFFNRVENIIPEKISEDAVYALFNTLNEMLQNSGRQGIIIVPVNPVPEGESEYITVTYRGEPKDVFNNLTDEWTAMLNISAYHYLSDENSNGFQYNYSQRASDGPAIVLVNRNRIKENPSRALVATAHELGHEQEEVNPKDVELDGELVSGVSPSTEVISTLFGLKMAEMLYEKTHDTQFIAHAARHGQLYNQVIYGNYIGTSSS